MANAGNLQEKKHVEILFYLRGEQLPGVFEVSDPDSLKPYQFPQKDSFDNAADLWKNAAKHLGGTAEEPGVGESIRKELERVLEVWKGDAADAFELKVKEVMQYAFQLAKICDTDTTVPQNIDATGALERDQTANLTDGYKQVLERLAGEIESAKKPENCPRLPWMDDEGRAGYSLGLEPCQPGMFGLSYQFKKDGGDTDMPIREDGGSVPESSMWDHYEKAGVATEEVTDAGDGWTYQDYYGGYVHVFLPKNSSDYSNWHKFWIYSGFNKDEHEKCKTTAGNLDTAYQQGGEDLPDPPQKVPTIGAQGGDQAGGPGGGAPGGGAPSAGGPGGSPSTPDMPKPPTTDPPSPPDIKPDPPKPPPIDPPRPPDQSDPPGPGDWEQTPSPDQPRTPDSDGDGIPDWQDPFPNDPDHNDDGIPDGDYPGGKPGKVDVGADAARAGSGFGGSTGGMPGGPGSIPGGAPAAAAGAAGAPAGGVPAAGAAGAAGGGLGAGATGATGGAFGAMPMGAGMGGGAHGQESGGEQQRNTWLEEDEDVWGADDDAPPPVIGG